MRRPATLLLIVLLLTTGCLGEPGAPPPAQDAPLPEDPTPSFTGPVNVSESTPAAEPVLARASDGTLYYQGIGSLGNTAGTIALGVAPQMVNSLWRSDDEGATWQPLPLPPLATNGTGDGFVAVAPDGTVYHANAFGPAAAYLAPPDTPPAFAGAVGTLQIHRSEDQGESWTQLAVPQVPDDLHRMWLVAGEGGDLHVAVAGNSPDPQVARPLWYLRSEDGGETWRDPVVIHETRSIGSDLALGPDGTLAIVVWDPSQEADFQLLRSTDDGATWEQVPMVGQDTGQGYATGWASLEALDDGRFAFLWAQEVEGDPQVLLTAGTDGGNTWSTPIAVAPAPEAQLLPWADALGADQLGVLFLQARTNATGGLAWYPTYARVTNLTTPDPEPLPVTDSPVHEGGLCVSGACSGEGQGNPFLEYTWLIHGPDGRAHLAFGQTGEGTFHALPRHAAGPT